MSLWENFKDFIGDAAPFVVAFILATLFVLPLGLGQIAPSLVSIHAPAWGATSFAEKLRQEQRERKERAGR